jgi:hypothetical protein
MKSFVKTIGSKVLWCGLSLRHANHSEADFSGADFSGADLCGAHLHRANYSNADFRGAILNHTHLYYTELTGANLTGTCLDPEAPVPELTDKEILDAGLEIRGDLVYGWRTKISQHADSTVYGIGREYRAPWFSVCRYTDCHPGLYLASWEWLRKRYTYQPRVRCYCRRDELVHAGDKWRAKRLWIVENDV